MADGDDVPYFFREIMAMITTIYEIINNKERCYFKVASLFSYKGSILEIYLTLLFLISSIEIKNKYVKI